MSLHKHIMVIESDSYGVLLSVLNQNYALSDENVFELSPTPSGGILILANETYGLLEQIHDSILNNKNTKAQIAIRLFADVKPTVLQAYLSQIQPQIAHALSVYETPSLIEAFDFAHHITSAGYEIFDFRVLRSHVNKCIVLTNYNLADLNNLVVIEQPNDLVKSYFGIS